MVESETVTPPTWKPKKAALIRARVHAYESAGSYAVEGMVRWLVSDDAYALAASAVQQEVGPTWAGPTGSASRHPRTPTRENKPAVTRQQQSHRPVNQRG